MRVYMCVHQMATDLNVHTTDGLEEIRSSKLKDGYLKKHPHTHTLVSDIVLWGTEKRTWEYL